MKKLIIFFNKIMIPTILLSLHDISLSLAGAKQTLTRSPRPQGATRAPLKITELSRLTVSSTNCYAIKSTLNASSLTLPFAIVGLVGFITIYIYIYMIEDIHAWSPFLQHFIIDIHPWLPFLQLFIIVFRIIFKTMHDIM